MKAFRAAEALSEIYPGVESTGHCISVPMAGHPITDEKSIRQDFETLRDLIAAHDAIFLLMDTRESRWLPTVMGKAAGKLVLNAALGFDTFVVMRHGIRTKQAPEQELGCYFCNDVVAPADVRTLFVSSSLIPPIVWMLLLIDLPTKRYVCSRLGNYCIVNQRSNPRSAMHRHPTGYRRDRLGPTRRAARLGLTASRRSRRACTGITRRKRTEPR